MSAAMSCKRGLKRLEHRSNNDDEDIVLYHRDRPVIKVQKGTTFGLAKMLYRSTGEKSRIIGLKPRKNAASLVCIITQDLTILTEQEYDLIMHEGDEGSNPHGRQDKSVNTLISLKPQFLHDNQAMIMDSVMLNTSQQGEENITDWLLKHRPNELSLATTNRDINLDTYVVKVNCNREKFSGSDSAVKHESACVLYNRLTSQESTSPSPTASDTDSQSPYSSSSPSQVYHSPFKLHRKSCNGINENIGNMLHGEVGEHEDGSRMKMDNKLKWQCLYCEKSFACRSALENHQRTHTGEKPFKCSECGRSFSHHGNLKQHLYIHREIKPHVCNVCGKGFTRSNRLRDHIQSHVAISEKNCDIRMRTKVVELSPVLFRNPSSSHEAVLEPGDHTQLIQNSLVDNDF